MGSWSSLAPTSAETRMWRRLWRSPSGDTRWTWLQMQKLLKYFLYIWHRYIADKVVTYCVCVRASPSCTCTCAAWRRAGSRGWWSPTGGTRPWPGGSSCPARSCSRVSSVPITCHNLSFVCDCQCCVVWCQCSEYCRKSINRWSCTITEKAPTRAFSWLKAATTTFKFKTLLRYYAKRAFTPR